SLLPEATAAWIVDHRQGIRRPMRKVHPAGFFEGLMPLGDLQFDAAGQLCTREACSAAGKTVRDVSIYNIEASDSTGKTTAMQDPYAAPSILSDFDRYLLGEGRHLQLYERLGAQPRTVDGKSGINFAVWAPNAR